MQATKASQNYFRLFGAHPVLGRVFSAQEDRLGGPQVIGRLARSVTLAQANSWMRVLGLRYIQKHPQQLGGDEKSEVTGLQEEMTGDIRPALLLLLGAVGLVLLIAFANVANLVLAHAAGRHREIAVRVALGAGRWRIARQLLTESLLLALAGGALGLVLGSWSLRALLALVPGNLPRIQELSSVPVLDPRVAGFAFLLAVATGILFGLFPALQASRIELVGGRAGTGRRHNRTRGLLVACEVAFHESSWLCPWSSCAGPCC